MEAQSGAGSKRGWCGELSSGAQSSSACSASQQQQTGSAGKRPKQVRSHEEPRAVALRG